MTNTEITAMFNVAQTSMLMIKNTAEDVLNYLKEFEEMEFENAVMKDEIQTINNEIQTQLQSMIDEITSIR